VAWVAEEEFVKLGDCGGDVASSRIGRRPRVVNADRIGAAGRRELEIGQRLVVAGLLS